MKKSFTIIALFLTTMSFAQTTTTTEEISDCCSEPKVSSYVSLGLSVTNSNDFKTSSYPSVECGLLYDNLGFAFVIGRGNLSGVGNSEDNIKNYYYELKTLTYFPLGLVQGSVLFGYGGYINTLHNFIEYGVGVSYSIKKFGYGVTYSNWDGVNYLTPSISYNF